ncbi:GATA type zinc finger protein asd-like protein [Hapsidospora chrysogenum ATCC 11550]|uniref:GATA type zinc finger protein asd-like protein n=1 Tax=Hapsidospora chrysogenum (strain ATCC 11550 / CBS 779.69 / DSM 880 / IAM 14645 / JCM 23072 / IMI 49137) TaxID=857340 RepID=A0A086STH8_HAPC1|nr:GATA type zinc finger protein asd-like protein [Hapsidospora chrysogenum ATCC 11550]
MMASNASSQMTCQNCSTSITPLWRRDEFGSVLCNACGLFLKLHGRPRPISLKTDVIKSRNRVKTMRPDGSTKKKSNHANPDGTNDGPISRTGTPSMYNNSLPSFMMDEAYSTAVTGFGANGTGGDGSGSPMSGEAPQTHEQLIANNSSLRTRVRELELINELFRGRLSQLEQQEAAARRGHEVAGVEQNQLRSQLEDSHGRENSLKRRLDEMELELEESHRIEDRLKHRVEELEAQLKEANEALEGDRPTKKPRLQSPEQSTAPQAEEASEAPPQETAAPEQNDDVGARVA